MKKTLKDTCEFFNGTGFPISFQGQSVGKYPFYKVGDISKNVQQGYKYLEVCENYINDDIVSQLKGTIIPANSIVFAKIGEALKLNRRAITKQPSLVDNNAIAIHPNEELLDVDYFFYFMKTVNLADYSSSTTVPSVKKSALDKIQLTVPSILTQKDIANELNCISDAISIAKSRLLSLDELIKSRFIEMFGNANDFCTLEELTTKITDGSHLPPKGIEKSNYLMLSSQNVYDELDLSNVRYLTKTDFDRENKRTDIKDGDVLLTIVGTIGRTYVVKNNEKYVFQRSVGVIKPIHGLLNGTFLSIYLRMPKAVNQLESSGHGSSQKGIYLQDLKKLLIPKVDCSLQNEFAEFVKLIDKSKFVYQFIQGTFCVKFARFRHLP